MTTTTNRTNRKARRAAPAFLFAARVRHVDALWRAVITAPTPAARDAAHAAWKAAK